MLVWVSVSLLAAVSGCGGDSDDAATGALQREIDDLEAQVDDLEAENAELRAALDEVNETTTAPLSTTASEASTTIDTGTTPATSAAESGSEPPEESYLTGTLESTLPAGEPDTVSVIAVGPVGSSTPVVVRNNTSETVQVHLTATARDPSGGLAGSGEDQGLEPPRVGAGEIAIGYVYLGIDEPPAGTTIDVTATGDEVDEEFDALSATITEHNLVKGEFGSQVVGIARNDNDVRLEGPISVLVMCFDSDGAPLSTYSGFTDVDALDPSQEGSFSVDLFKRCPQYLLGASGYLF